MSDEADFLSVEDHFQALVSQLDPSAIARYHELRHTRAETAFEGRQFILYRMGGNEPRELGRILIEDLEIGHEGLTSKVSCLRTERELIVGYSPVQLWDYPVFVFLPLHAKVRFASTERDVGKRGSLAWPMIIRTRSRRGLREPGITYCETGPSFAEEFDRPFIA